MSQFASLFKTDTKEKKEAPAKTKPKVQTEKEKTKNDSQSPAAEAMKILPQVKVEKRTPGKSSNTDYAQVLTYIRKDTHNAVKAALIFDDRKRNVSDLVEELLAGWVKNKK
jgi:hypothetical protein